MCGIFNMNISNRVKQETTNDFKFTQQARSSTEICVMVYNSMDIFILEELLGKLSR